MDPANAYYNFWRVLSPSLPEDAGRSLVQIRQIVLEDHRVPAPGRLPQPSKRFGPIGHAHEMALAAPVAMPGHERLAIGLGDNDGRVAHGRGLARQRSVDVELILAQLDHAWRHEEPPDYGQRGRHLECGPEAELVRVVRIANPRDPVLLDDLQAIVHRFQRPDGGDDDPWGHADRRGESEGSGDVQDNRPAEKRRETGKAAVSGLQDEGGALLREFDLPKPGVQILG
jgi:hypothetical protein